MINSCNNVPCTSFIRHADVLSVPGTQNEPVCSWQLDFSSIGKCVNADSCFSFAQCDKVVISPRFQGINKALNVPPLSVNNTDHLRLKKMGMSLHFFNFMPLTKDCFSLYVLLGEHSSLTMSPK